MSNWYGDIREDGTIEILFNTYDANGASISFTGDTLKVYKDNAIGTEVTEGITLSKDHDDITGAHLVTIAATHAFYATGSDYQVQLQDASVNSQTVNSFIGSFSIENRTASRAVELLEADEKLDYGLDPAKRIIYRKGTTTEILKKGLFKIDGTSDVTSVIDTIGMSVDITV